MPGLKFVPTTLMYIVPYVLIQTFSYQVVKDGVTYSSPSFLMGFRFLIASFLIFGVARNFRPIFNKDTMLLSLFTAASTGFWALGLEYVSPAESAVLSYTMPLLSIPISSAILSETPTTREWGGTVIGFVGVLVYSLAFANHALTILGATFTLMNAFFWAMYTVYYRKLRIQDPTMTIATQLLLAGLLLLLFAPFDYRLAMGPNFLFDLMYLSVLSGAVAFFIWNTMVRLRKIGKTCSLIYLIPVTTTLVQSVESAFIPSPISLTGLGLMTIGIYISTGTMVLQQNARRLGSQISKLSQGLHF